MTLHDMDVYKCIHASECSFLVAVVYETPDLFCCTPPPHKLIFPQLCDGKSGAGGVLCTLGRSSLSGDVT